MYNCEKCGKTQDSHSPNYKLYEKKQLYADDDDSQAANGSRIVSENHLCLTCYTEAKAKL